MCILAIVRFELKPALSSVIIPNPADFVVRSLWDNTEHVSRSLEQGDERVLPDPAVIVQDPQGRVQQVEAINCMKERQVEVSV
jgi:hypothetical protein